MPTLKELNEDLRQKGAALKSFMDSKKDATGGLNMNGEDIAEARRRNDELNAIGARVSQAQEAASIEEAALKAARLPMPAATTATTHDPAHPKGGPEEPGTGDGAFKSLGQMFTESEDYLRHQHSGNAQYKALVSGRTSPQAAEAVKAVMTTTAGFAPQNNRGPIVVPFAIRRPMIADLIPSDHTENSIIRYMEFNTWVNGVAPVAEGAVKPMSSLGAVERDVPLQAIAGLLPVTEQQLRYVPQLRALIDNQLGFMLKLTEETQFLYGNGTTPNLQGFLTKTGVATYAQGTAGVKENIADAIYNSYTQIRAVGFAEPTGTVISPYDYQTLRLLKTSQGAYIWGNPDEAGIERIWGKPAIVTTAITQGTALSGDFAMWSHCDRALDITIEVGYINDDFARNQKTLRVEEYVALEILRPSAFSQTTALVAVAP